jgi:siroheme synthase-like protein
MYLPLLFEDNFSSLIVGGGQVATRKMETLLQVPSRITIVAPRIADRIDRNVQGGSIRWIPREYALGDCRGFQLVIAATPVKEVNRKVSDEARELGIPVNVVDDPALSTVIFPAIWRDKSLLVAVSTEGVAPFMASEIRNRLACHAEGMGYWVEIAGRFRDVVRNEVRDPGEREKLYKRFVDAGQPKEDDCPPASGKLSDWLRWIDNIKRGCSS